MGPIGLLVGLVLPTVELVCLGLAITWRSRSPLWVAVSGALVLAFIAVSGIISLSDSSGMAEGMVGIVVVWVGLGAILAGIGGIAIVGRWDERGALVVAGLALPSPVVALMLFASAAALLGS